ncbi:RES family NAD+ phosphorylase [Cellvibrio sp. OA-2007]|uniref:RES family NAD+ phosphorylase n=1 Tax=Cellvibrio sp. OA-2007 TaxID=529823 RepID=UPI00078112A3|nr:RES family NAD+ phosphorylase [Cellvibrio sp. OA-2007]
MKQSAGYVRQNDLEFTRAIGDEWLISGSSLFMRVPSAVVPHSFNYLFNPRHVAAANAEIISVRQYPFDTRFLL